jgi:DNA-binding XRE family transcriptional regulator
MTTHLYGMPILSRVEHPRWAISASERAFFARVGARKAEPRKQHDIFRVEMGKAVGVSQQTINFYEVALRHMPQSSLPVIARYPRVSIEELIGEPPSGRLKCAARPRRPSSRSSASRGSPKPSSALSCRSSTACSLSSTAKG